MIKYKIGIIDDEEAQDYKDFYDMYGFESFIYDVDINSSLESILDWIYQNEIEMLIVDYSLMNGNGAPFNGDEILNYIKSYHTVLPVIIWTSLETDARSSELLDHWSIQEKNQAVHQDYMKDEIKQTIDIVRRRRNKWKDEFSKYYSNLNQLRPYEVEQMKIHYHNLRKFGDVDEISSEFLDGNLKRDISEISNSLLKIIEVGKCDE